MGERAVTTIKKPEAKQTCPNSCNQKFNFNSSGSTSDRMLKLQRSAGNKAVQKLIKSRALQTKLRIGQPNDIYEQEADRVAEQVMRMPDPILQPKKKCPLNKYSSCTENDEELKNKTLMKKEAQTPTQNFLVPSIVHEVLRSPGQPLDKRTRSFMEPRFGQDFSRVRVHTDDRAKDSAQSVNALAYTVGNNIVFGKGQYRPNSEESRKLVAHELSHVVQQRGSTELARTNISTGRSGDSLKTQAGSLVDSTESEPSLNYPLNSIHTDNLSNTLQRLSESCPPEGVTIEEEHAGLCSEIKRELGELEKYSTPQIKELTPKKCYLLWGFGSDSAKFGALPELNEIAKLFSENSDSIMNIDGYTDCIRIDKNPAANEELRWRRADRVAKYFINLKGLDSKRIFTGAPPNNQYVHPNGAAEDRAMNRSVTINLTAGKKITPTSSPPCILPVLLGSARGCGSGDDFRHFDFPSISTASSAKLAAWAAAHGPSHMPFRSSVTNIECELEMAGVLLGLAGVAGHSAFSRFRAGSGGTVTHGSTSTLGAMALVSGSFLATVKKVKAEIEAQLAAQALKGALNPCALSVTPPATHFGFSDGTALKAVIGGTQGESLFVTSFRGNISMRSYTIGLRFVICDDFGVDESDLYAPGLFPFWVLQHERSATMYAPFINELDLSITESGTF